MAALGQCDCGHVIRGESRVSVVEALRSHVITSHQGSHLQLVHSAPPPPQEQRQPLKAAR